MQNSDQKYRRHRRRNKMTQDKKTIAKIGWKKRVELEI